MRTLLIITILLCATTAFAQPAPERQNIIGVHLGTGLAWVSEFDQPWAGYIGFSWHSPRHHRLTARILRVVDIDEGITNFFTQSQPALNLWDIGLLYGRDFVLSDKWRLGGMAGISVVRKTTFGGIIPGPGLYTESAESSAGLPLEFWLKRNVGKWSYISLLFTNTLSKFKPHICAMLMLSFPVRAL